jgi:hypothetical protein
MKVKASQDGELAFWVDDNKQLIHTKHLTQKLTGDAFG